MFYADTKNPEKGIALCKEGLGLAERNGQSYSNLNSLYKVLGKNYLVAGDYKKYGETLATQLALKDSIYKRNSVEAMAEMQAKYDVQKKEIIIIRQKLDLVQKNYFLYGSFLLLLLLSLLGYVLFKSYRRKQKIKLQLMQVEEKSRAEKAVADAEEAERKRIAADLHDNLGTYAATIVSNIDHLRLASGEAHYGVALQELRNNSQSIVSELSDTIWALKKDSLSLTAISDRIKTFIQRIQSSYPEYTIDVVEAIATDWLLSPSKAFHLFRMVQEAIINSLKHSHGTQLMVLLEGSESWKITVTDNGNGMLQKQKNDGNGLLNMKERAGESGWSVAWEPNNPVGTSVIIQPTTN